MNPGNPAKSAPVIEGSTLESIQERLLGARRDIGTLQRLILDFLLGWLNCERAILLHGRDASRDAAARQPAGDALPRLVLARSRWRAVESGAREKTEGKPIDLELRELPAPAAALQRALQSEGPLVLHEGSAELGELGGQRSALCQPFHLPGSVAGLLYLDRPLGRAVFTEEDEEKIREFSRQGLLVLEIAYLELEIEKLGGRASPDLQGEAPVEGGLEDADDPGEEKPWAGLAGEVRNFHGIVGQSPKMVKIFEVVEKIKDSDFNVCILGESGTGKELLAKAIHESGKRRQAKFISENCGAISETLLESELFGHVKGAFTGAEENRQGLFELANGGTLFLDEIGDMSEGMQRKLLRVLQEGVIRPIGGKNTVQVDVRVICASNRDLRQLVDKGAFRADLYYRLNVIALDLPPLRERPEDIPAIIETVLEEIDRQEGVRRRLSESALRALLSYTWPGNVRELSNVLRRVLVTGSKRLVTRKEILPLLSGGPARSYVGEGLEDGESQIHLRVPRRSNFNEIIEECEKAILLNALKENRWNKSRVTQILQIPRQSLYNKIAKYNLKKKWEK